MGNDICFLPRPAVSQVFNSPGHRSPQGLEDASIRFVPGYLLCAWKGGSMSSGRRTRREAGDCVGIIGADSEFSRGTMWPKGAVQRQGK